MLIKNILFVNRPVKFIFPRWGPVVLAEDGAFSEGLRSGWFLFSSLEFFCCQTGSWSLFMINLPAPSPQHLWTESLESD